MPEYDFFSFLKDITNEALVPLQDNSNYDTMITAVANEFSKVYKRFDDIKLKTVLADDTDNTFQKNLDNNLKVVGETETIYTDVLLNKISEYFDTDHFKDTMSLMIKKWQEREEGGISDIEVFVQENIIPYFKFFTLNSGDLHKTKGTKPLLENLFNFYGEANSTDRSFDEVLEYDDPDVNSNRFNAFTSSRVLLNEDLLSNNFTTEDDLTITKYISTSNNKLILAGGHVFISTKSREDWWEIGTADDILKLNEDFFVIYKDNELNIYDDSISIYNDTYEFVSPVILKTYSDVFFVPRVNNIEDRFGQYHANNIYYVTIDTGSYNLKRVRYNSTNETITDEVMKEGMTITFDDRISDYSNGQKFDEIISIDWLWMNLYDDDATVYEYNEGFSDVEYVVTYTIDVKELVLDFISGNVLSVPYTIKCLSEISIL